MGVAIYADGSRSMSVFSDKNTGEKNVRNVIGYDLGEEFAQISYWSLAEEEPETISAVVGTQQYNIPTVLCRKHNTEQWLYGKEAMKYAAEEEGILVEDLLNLAKRTTGF